MKKLFLLNLLLLTSFIFSVSDAQILISGFLANPPTNNDAPYEYVQLIATQNINFSSSNYCVVWANNGTASADGWIAGGMLTYGFNLTSGSVNKGDVFYVGGDGKVINGAGSTDISSEIWIRAINTSTTTGDGFGTNGTTGQLGNGGFAADGIAVFAGKAENLTNLTIPIDAVFYGSAVGTARPATGGYTLPDNDRYTNSQGTFGNGTNTFILPNPNLTSNYLKLTGTYFPLTQKWDILRTGQLITLTQTTPVTTIATGITLSEPKPGIYLTSIPPSQSYIFSNSSDNILQIFKISVKDMSAVLDTLKINLGGNFAQSDFTQINLIYSSDSIFNTSDSVVKTLSTVKKGSISFDSIAFKMDSASTGYFIITVNVSSSATVNNTIFVDKSYFKDFIFQKVKFYGTEPLTAGGMQTIVPAGTAFFKATQLNNFGNVDVGTKSAEQSFALTGTNLPVSGSVVVTPAPGFKISYTSGSGYSGFSKIKAFNSSTVWPIYVYVIFEPTSYKTYSDSLRIGDQAGLVNAIYVYAKGTGASTDYTAPVVDTAYAVSSTRIKVVFSEPVSNTAEITTNYTIPTGVTSAIRTASLDTVYLTLTTALPVATNVNLTIRNIQDTCINHNQMPNQQTFVVRYGTIVIKNYAIKDVTGVNPTTGQADSINVYCRLNGVIQSINFSQNVNNSLFYIHDNTDGIQVNRTGAVPVFNVVRGDRVRVIGRIQQQNGVTRLQADSIVVIESGQAERTPTEVKVLDETTESEVIRLNNIMLTNPAEWPITAGATRTVNVTDGTNNFVIIIFTRCNIQGTPAPTGTFDIMGIGSQADNSTPFLQGYTIWPRDLNDLVIAPPYQTYTIAQVHTENSTTGEADSVGLYCRLVGVVHGINESTTGGLSFTIIDKTGGINVFNYGSVNPPYYPVEGDEVAVVGSIMQYDGLTEIYADSVQVLSYGNTTASAIVTDVLDETTESKLVQIKNLSIVPPSQWPVIAVKNVVDVEVTDGAHNFMVRIYPACDIQGTAAPKSKFNITGLGSQSDPASPFTDNYYLVPRYVADVTPYTGLNDNNFLSDVNVYPNPASGYFYVENSSNSRLSVEVYNYLGDLLYKTIISQQKHRIDLSAEKGLYLIKLTDISTSQSKTFKIGLN